MIGRLRGIILEKQAPEVLIEVSGVGYEVQLPLTSFFQLPDKGAEAIIYTHFVVREDAQLLFGFAHQDERSLFRELIKANGVGPKLALTILSGMSAEQFVHCVQIDDITTLVKLPGVGKKTAERLVVEMRDRLKNWFEKMGQSGMVPANIDRGAVAAILPQPNDSEDAVSALLALGYKPQQASKAVKTVYKDGMASEEIIREALRSLA